MDFEKYTNSKLYAFFDILYKLMLINVIWFVVTITGLGILTYFPITVCLFILINTVIEQKEFPIFKAYWGVFKKIYWKAEKVFLIYFLMGIILYFNVRTYYYQVINNENFLYNFGFWITLILILIYLLSLTQVFLMFLYFPNLKTFQVIKYSFLFSLAYPFRSILLVLINVGSIFLILALQFLTPLVFIILESIIAYLSIKVVRIKYNTLLKDKSSVNVFDYIE